jgi:hypothetical protein
MSFFDDAIANISATQVRASVLGYLQAAGLLITNWRVVSVGRQMFEGFVAQSTTFQSAVSVITRGFVSLDLSTDPGDVDPYNPVNQTLTPASGFLSALGKNWYNTEREGATFAEGIFHFVNAGPGARTLNVETVIFTWTDNSPPDPPPTYINIDDPAIYTLGSVVVPAGTSIDLPIQCQVQGSIGSAPSSSLSLTTTLVGCSGTNPAAVVGSDREDKDSYVTKCKQMPARLSLGGPADAYAYLSNKNLDGTPLLNDSIPPVPSAISRVQVTQDSATGIVQAYFASGAGPAIADDVTAANQNIKFNAFAVPDAITQSGVAATSQTLHVQGTAKIKSRPGITRQSVAEGIAAALVASGSKIPIGGVDQVLGSGVIYTRDLEAASRAGYAGVYDLIITLPAADTTAVPVGHVVIITSDPGDGAGSADWTITLVP